MESRKMDDEGPSALRLTMLLLRMFVGRAASAPSAATYDIPSDCLRSTRLAGRGKSCEPLELIGRSPADVGKATPMGLVGRSLGAGEDDRLGMRTLPFALVLLMIDGFLPSSKEPPFELTSSSSATLLTSPHRDIGRAGIRRGLMSTVMDRVEFAFHPSSWARL
jgi:hypothetical protein